LVRSVEMKIRFSFLPHCQLYTHFRTILRGISLVIYPQNPLFIIITIDNLNGIMKMVVHTKIRKEPPEIWFTYQVKNLF
jgi:hypothetical protein